MESLNLYQVFYEVACCGSFSLAAEKLYISQPAISKSIAHLEEELKTPLFYRFARGSKLTPEGELLFLHVESALSSLKKGENMLKALSDNGIITLSIGISTTLCKFILLPFLKNFINEHPNIKLNIKCQATADTLIALKNGDLELALIGSDPNTDHLSYNGLVLSSLKKIEDIFVASNSYITGIRNTTEIFDNDFILRNATFILLNKENVSRKYVDSFFDKYKVYPENIMEVTNMDLAIEFAKAGLGIACVISDFIQEELQSDELCEIKILSRVPKRKIAFAYSSKVEENPGIQSLLHFYKDHIN